MGFFKAVGACYANMFNFSGRARRAEFWWFVLFQILVIFGGLTVWVWWLASNPELVRTFENVTKYGATPPVWFWTYMGYVMAGYVVLLWLPATASVIRRLHDTNRSGGWYFIQFVPFIGGLWIFVLMVLPGSHGTNRFGPDSVPGRKRKKPAHPAFTQELEGEERAEMERERKAEIKSYYRKNVLPNIQKA